ncbi:hypothetical protein NDU88_000777 [Pleurodeles waltl]|uniref:Uncharacterized protein n=1 Tax=Pleurodeles waltl TaxID=8319 RepID=A0AAV7TG00_PLEWA|nr:hypothetical protein NDU88_000777 [Pleurodeles waltl]
MLAQGGGASAAFPRFCCAYSATTPPAAWDALLHSAVARRPVRGLTVPGFTRPSSLRRRGTCSIPEPPQCIQRYNTSCDVGRFATFCCGQEACKGDSLSQDSPDYPAQGEAPVAFPHDCSTLSATAPRDMPGPRAAPFCAHQRWEEAGCSFHRGLVVQEAPGQWVAPAISSRRTLISALGLLLVQDARRLHPDQARPKGGSIRVRQWPAGAGPSLLALR